MRCDTVINGVKFSPKQTAGGSNPPGDAKFEVLQDFAAPLSIFIPHLSRKLRLLEILDERLQALGHPLVFMIDQLFPDVGLHLGNMEINKLALPNLLRRHKFG